MRRAVLDPNVLISGLRTPRGATAKILLHLRDGAFELVTSPRLVAELRDVLRREKLRRYVTLDEADEFIALIERASMSHPDPAASGPALGADPGDEYLIRLARSARVDALVSGDPHLLRLRRDIPVKSPRDFIDSLE